MKMNLFSVFNPVTSEKYSMMWMTMMLILTSFPMKMWKEETKLKMITDKMIMSLQKQFKTMTKKSMTPNTMMMLSTLMTILMMNTLGLLPFTYPQTSQPQITLSMALPMWLGIMMMKMKSFNKMMAHMVPMSTPKILVPLMVVIETISTLIQPITLSIRLMANITAGHILMILISSSHSMSWTSSMTLLIQTMFTMMEMFVSLIQAYVFSMLLTMYLK